MRPFIRNILVVFLMIIAEGCHFLGGGHPETLFRSIPSSYTGITFANKITYTKKFNVLTYPYLYNGGGVAAGDINSDGLSDLYFTGNMTSGRLYLNKGHLRFKDITESSGTSTNGWASGVSMVDINHDGLVDIYVSVSGSAQTTPQERANLLFINNGDCSFTESAVRYGIADTGFTTQAAFLDYDRDGDLDLFLINNFPGSFSRDSKIGTRKEVNDGSSESTDILYQNDGGRFTNVSREAGILKEGYSLGIVVSDVNRDGWPDIYISNDVQTDDVLYINNHNGTFTDKAAGYFKHTSFAGMGADIADFNNDGWPDVLQVDMRPSTLYGRQLVAGAMDYKYLREIINEGHQYQYAANSLQLSNGRNEQGDVIFSEIAELAGIAATDWSWSALFADFDNDGLKDILITNGYPKAVTDYDYLIRRKRLTAFGTDSTRKGRSFGMMNNLGAIKRHNYLYKNNGNLTFSDVSERWGFTRPAFSYGAVYADLDNDGDLDIVINNSNGEARVWRNTADSSSGNHYLEIHLKGDSLNTEGIGSKIILSSGGRKQYISMQPYRGYLSSMMENLHFGLGKNAQADTLEIYWPNGHYQRLCNIKADTIITLSYRQSEKSPPADASNNTWRMRFTNVSEKLNIRYKHKENRYNDFKREPLLPYMLSRMGPAVAAGDVNNDGLQDFYIGGAAGQPGSLFIQRKDGTFMKSIEGQPWNDDRMFEDTGALFLDANDDGSPDLYVVSGGYGLPPASVRLQDRLYINNRHGRFVRNRAALPDMPVSGSCVKAGDYDGDGDPDLFVGGGVIPGKYPYPAQSYILQNNHGIFRDVTPKIAPGLEKGGLVTDALWMDFDGNGTLDLVTSGEWSPVRFYKNDGGIFTDATAAAGLKDKTGWWSSLAKGDFDNDGDLDIVAGNFGLNSGYSPPDGSVLEIFASDFDHNGMNDIILAIQKGSESYPLSDKRSMTRQMLFINHKFPSFHSYAHATVADIVGKKALEKALHYQAKILASSLLKNEGHGIFTISPLPVEAQLSAVNAIIPVDVDEDGNLDVIIAGNRYNMQPGTTRNDAGNGLWLRGDGHGNFRAVPPARSGLMAPGDVRDLALIPMKKGRVLLIANNDDSLQAFRISGK